MTNNYDFDVIITGGSYAGLSAAMSLGRALRNVLVIDSGKPCNRQTPHSHNFLTRDGQTPAGLSALAKAQVAAYPTVRFYEGLAISGSKTDSGFEIRTQAGARFTAKKLVFASGVRDIMPDIKGFAECWGITVIHCPYCHGYEVRQERTGILANGDGAFEYAKLLSNWTKDLTIFTNGPSILSAEQAEKIRSHQINIVETVIDSFEHDKGQLQQIRFRDGSAFPLKAIYARPQFEQHSDIPVSLGCELTEHGLLKVDAMQRTNIPGIYACGDNAGAMRSVANAVATGSAAGAVLNREMIDEAF
ncbi:NAD(P)/FAD-dependent oxidoreductase [uncultured Chitinophaga sp.]|jgi:Thioredoxin reductase|uniref:NAD(P)/FAD-dependent oxidoreductase n=1 Tax=uncultured Chitinophaga sp. TaxID=339340 RepID=UPI0026337B67|nr:NAD(P)/FAD-dependent oxidoreductase [uncultured Chitinophaga sp.]